MSDKDLPSTDVVKDKMASNDSALSDSAERLEESDRSEFDLDIVVVNTEQLPSIVQDTQENNGIDNTTEHKTTETDKLVKDRDTIDKENIDKDRIDNGTKSKRTDSERNPFFADQNPFFAQLHLNDTDKVDVVLEEEEGLNEETTILPQTATPLKRRYVPKDESQLSSVSSRGRHVGGARGEMNRQQSATQRARHHWGNIKQSVSHSVADFFGVAETTAEDHDAKLDKWKARSRLLHSNSVVLNKRFNSTAAAKSKRNKTPTPMTAGVYGDDGYPMTPLATLLTGPEDVFMGAGGETDGDSSVGARSIEGRGAWGKRPTPQPIDPFAVRHMRQLSGISTTSVSRRATRAQPVRRKRNESVLKMTYDGIKNLAQGTPTTDKKNVFTRSRSVAPAAQLHSAAVRDDIEMTLDDVFFDMPPVTPGQMSGLGTAGILGAAGLSTAGVLGTAAFTPEVEFFRSLPPRLPSISETTPPVSHDQHDLISEPADMSREPTLTQRFRRKARKSMRALCACFMLKHLNLDSDGVFETPSIRAGKPGPGLFPSDLTVSPEEEPSPESEREEGQDETDGFVANRRIPDKVMNAMMNVNRRELGVGLVGAWLDRDYRISRIDSHIEQQMSEITEYRTVGVQCHTTGQTECRPYFTYWVTFVQIVVYIFSIAVYQLASFGFSETVIEEQVLRTSLAIERCQMTELENMWLGPRQADLIHLGAKYSPCMRRDAKVYESLQQSRERERETACCVRNDGSGCYQSSKAQCSKTLSTWLKYSEMNSSKPGTVCGHDPSFCSNPPPIYPGWNNNITEWPECRERNNITRQEEKHMLCSVVGRPCCVGIHGRCIMTTREYCNFRRGYFHDELTLCSQVSCMSEICGMLPFTDAPNQFYRLWTSLFLHAGLIQLGITVAFQMLIMRDLEKLAGWLRIGIIYIVSGVAGSLASAIFLPYHVEAGPAGSQFALMACLFVEVIQSWQMLASPCWALMQLALIVAVLFSVGFLPWIDNYAHAVGFLFGFLLSFALLPYVTFNLVDRRGKKIGIVVCLLVSAGLFSLLVVWFYVIPISDCEVCRYLNCLPFTSTFCKSMEVDIKAIEEEL